MLGAGGGGGSMPGRDGLGRCASSRRGRAVGVELWKGGVVQVQERRGRRGARPCGPGARARPARTNHEARFSGGVGGWGVRGGRRERVVWWDHAAVERG
jgi:hypothetical protein